MKKITGFLIAAAVLFHLINFPAAASTKTVSGMCGTAAAFTIDENGTLTITGTGKIDKFFFDDKEIEYKKIIKIVDEVTTCHYNSDRLSLFAARQKWQKGR